MGFIYEQRLSDSPYVATVTHGRTAGSGSTIRPAESHWHMVFTKVNGSLYPIVVGPLTASGIVPFTEGVEILWIKFKLGTFMSHLPVKHYTNIETFLPDATSKTFWLGGSSWQVPNFENVETFLNRLVHEEVLVRDPLVSSVLDNHPHDLSSRTVRHRFLQATGLTQTQVRQIERAQKAAELLRQGVSILDTMYEFGYFDQPHLTRSLKQWVGHTPAQLLRTTQSA